MAGISFTCPSCGAQVPVPDGSDPSSCPRCGYNVSGTEGSAATRGIRRCLNCKKELRGGVTICPQCGTDQETGKRAFGAKKRSGAPASMESGRREREFPFATLAVLAVLALGIGICIVLLTRDSPSSSLKPPTRVAPLRPPTVSSGRDVARPPVVASNTVPVETPPTQEDHFATALKQYETALRQGRIDTAQQNRLQIEHRFAAGRSSAAFWKQTFAPTSCVSLTLYSVCTVCSDGTCPVCQGRPTCASCKGSGTCTACKGVPTRQVSCPSCICPTCDGNGRCTTCSGSGSALCAVCGGIGYTEKRNQIACGSCSGTGQRKGLRTANGYMPMRCLTCNGTGKIAQTIRLRCTACNGVTRMKCTACSGNGHCAPCRGTGRTPGCVVCGGKGVIDVVCKTCNGNRKCPTCSGVGHCQRCQGTGACYLCGRSCLVREIQFPVPASWLSSASGFILFDVDAQKIVQSGTKAGHQQVSWKGKSLTFDVSQDEQVWISTGPSFLQIAQLFVRE